MLLSSAMMVRHFALLGLLPLAALPGCDRSTEEAETRAPAPENVVANRAAPPPLVPRPAPPADRAELLLAVFKARSAAATGQDDREEQAALDGRPFSFRIRLGCALDASGAESADARPADARYDTETRRVTLSALPNMNAEAPVAAAISGDAFEAVEGFWIADPWLLAAHCSASGGGGAAVGIAQFFTADEPRTMRREGRPYQAREQLPEGTAPEVGSWELVLTGRLTKIGDGRVVQCRAVESGPPACIISVRFDRVEIVNHRTGEQLAQWRAG